MQNSAASSASEVISVLSRCSVSVDSADLIIPNRFFVILLAAFSALQPKSVLQLAAFESR
jgi:Flp pilus assembly protein protease CpaA